MVLIFGGTTEGKQVTEVLQKLRLEHTYSTKTEIEVVLDELGSYRYGAFTASSLKKYIIENEIKIIIHASHPFATQLHQTISEASIACEVPVFRLERQFPERQVSKEIHYVEGYPEAVELINKSYPNKALLALTGVQSISKLPSYWRNNKTYFRILDRQSSIDIAMESNFSKEQLILGYPSKKVKEEVELITRLNIELILTKESGESGALSLKIEAAQQCKTPIIILKRPSLPKEFRRVKNKIELENILLSSNLTKEQTL
jgi:precorrin-6x reductase